MDKYYFSIYSFFNNSLIHVLRILIFVVATLFLVVNYNHIFNIKLFIIFYSLFLVNEVFLSFKIFRTKPFHKAGDTVINIEDVVCFSALYAYKDHKNAYEVIKSLLKRVEVNFISQKIGQNFNLVQNSTITKEELLKKAYEITLQVKEDYITEVDLFVSYLMLTEETSRMLERNNIKNEDLLNLLHWARHKYAVKENGLHFTGEGIFDFFIFGWNVETQKYANDLTSKIFAYKFPPVVIGRENEYQEMLTDLCKDSNNNILLVGESGTGKTTLVEYFAYQSYLGNITNNLSHKRVFEVYPDRIISGVKDKGELESRINDLFSDVYHSGNTLIFIQNIENIFGKGGLEFDISSVIFQYLKDRKIQIISTTTYSSYKTFIENRQDVKEFFEVIRLDEPDSQNALFMLFEKVVEKEAQYKISFTYSAVKSVIEFSGSYAFDKYLPGKAINLLDEVGSQARMNKQKIIDRNDIVAKIEQTTKIVLSEPSNQEKNVLLHLEDEMHKRLVGQDEAVSSVCNSIRRLRSGFASGKRPISTFLFMGPTGVGKTEMARTLASIYFGDEKNMIRLDMSEYQTQDSIKRLLGSLPGEEYSPSEFLEQVKAKPFSLILLDEFEKAHPRILDVFLQVFEDGRLTDNSGKTVSFVNTIIIATSNAGAELIREQIAQGLNLQSLKTEILDYLQKNQLFRPELLNRFDEIIVFKPLDDEEVKSIAKLLLGGMLKAVENKNIYISFNDKVLDKIAKESYDPQFGARNIRRFLEGNIENVISKMILENSLKTGDRKLLTVNEIGEITVI